MDLAQILTPESVLPNLRVATKRQALHEMARRASVLTACPDRTILDILLEREKLGSTGVGMGVALPHSKGAAIPQIIGVFARLDRPINFDAIDDQPVDLLFLLLAPETAGAEHLRMLAHIARLLRRREICEKLRGTDDRTALFALLTEKPAASNAA